MLVPWNPCRTNWSSATSSRRSRVTSPRACGLRRAGLCLAAGARFIELATSVNVNERSFIIAPARSACQLTFVIDRCRPARKTKSPGATMRQDLERLTRAADCPRRPARLLLFRLFLLFGLVLAVAFANGRHLAQDPQQRQADRHRRARRDLGRVTRFLGRIDVDVRRPQPQQRADHATHHKGLAPPVHIHQSLLCKGNSSPRSEAARRAAATTPLTPITASDPFLTTPWMRFAASFT